MVERDDEDKASIVATSEISFDFDNNSRISLDTKDMIEQITGEMDPSYDETSKTLVKEILNQVVSRISFKSSTDLIEDFHKELEVQKIILLETASSILPKTDSLLSKISETEQEDASCSSTSSKNIAPDIAQSSDLSLSNYTSRSELKLHMKVPSNTPDAFKASLKYAEEEQLKLTQKMLKEDVKADIDKTLQLLETAKNKLLTYLNQGQTPIDNAAKINNDKITIDPFKSLENKELFPVPPKLPETPKKEVDFKYEDVFAYNKKKTKDFSDNKKPKPEETAIVEIGPRNNPIHELKHMFLDEFKKQVDFVPTVTDDEVFDLENLAHANVFVDNKKIKTMIDRYLTPEQIKDLKEDEMISHNTDIFEKRYSSSSESAKPSKITQERLRDDIDIIVRELLEHSAAFQDYVKANEQGDSTNDTIEDVKFVLEKLLQHVVDEVSTSENDAPKTPLDYQVNHLVKPVYFCLIDDYVDVFPTVGRAGDSGPLSWLTHRLRKCAVTEKKSTISVRRCYSNGQRNYTGPYAKNTDNDGLLEKLIKGTNYLTELYKEIYSRPLNWMQLGKYQLNPFAMDTAKESTMPLLRKSKKIITFDDKPDAQTSTTRDRETVEEKLKMVINPGKEREVIKASKMQKHFDSSQCQDLSLSIWPSWKREWIKIFTAEHASNEREGLKQLSDLVNIKQTYNHFSGIDLNNNKPVEHKLGRINLKKNVRINPLTVKKEFNMHHNLMEISPEKLPNDESDDEISEEIIGATKVHFTNSDDDEPQKKVEKVVPVYPIDDAIPGTSRDSQPNLVLIHSEKHSPCESGTRIVDFADLPSSEEKIYEPVADVPRRFATSSMEHAYMKNLAVLQNKVDCSSLSSIYSSSSSEGSYQVLPKIYPQNGLNYNTPSMVAHFSDISKANRIPNSTSTSIVSSRSADSPPETVDYYADVDNYTQIIPELRPEYFSKPDLNPPDEVARIEENVLKNDRLNPLIRSLSLQYSHPSNALRMGRISSSLESLTSTTSHSLVSTTDGDFRER